jgi:hypothetical protein
MVDDSNKGLISAWNEGDYKNLRLHRAQNMINIASMSPFAKITLYDISMYGYEFWLQGINSLFREGKSKYSGEEFKEVVKLREECEKLINNNKISFPVNGLDKKGYGYFPDKWKELKQKLQEYEDKVYFYNESHGLSTRNIDDEEDW